jgi:hypothetical protein
MIPEVMPAFDATLPYDFDRSVPQGHPGEMHLCQLLSHPSVASNEHCVLYSMILPTPCGHASLTRPI